MAGKCGIAGGRLLDFAGERLHVVDEGAGDPPLVLVHGLGGSVFSWRDVIPALAAAHRVVALDLAGFGASGLAKPGGLSHTAQAERVARVMRHLGVSGAVLAGHSMGGGIAQRVAASDPELVSALVLVAAVDASDPPERYAGRGRRVVARLAAPAISLTLRFPRARRWAVKQVLRRMVADPRAVTPAMVDGYAAPLTRRRVAAILRRLPQDVRADTPLDLRAIAQPVLVVSGAQDRVVPPAAGARLAEAIPGAGHVVIERSGHLVAEEQPQALLAAIEGFLAG